MTIWRVGDIYYNTVWFHLYNVAMYFILSTLVKYPDNEHKRVWNMLVIKKVIKHIFYLLVLLPKFLGVVCICKLHFWPPPSDIRFPNPNLPAASQLFIFSVLWLIFVYSCLIPSSIFDCCERGTIDVLYSLLTILVIILAPQGLVWCFLYKFRMTAYIYVPNLRKVVCHCWHHIVQCNEIPVEK